MRQLFLAVETLAEAENLAPWAAEIIKVEGGFRAFESVRDAKTWNSQE